jgi:hypothetical protein
VEITESGINSVRYKPKPDERFCSIVSSNVLYEYVSLRDSSIFRPYYLVASAALPVGFQVMQLRKVIMNSK